MSSRRRNRIIAAVVAVLAVFALLVGAWAVDSSSQSGRTARGLTVAGRPIGGLTETELRAATEALATSYEGAWVSVSTPAGDLDTTAGALGLTLDTQAVAEAALAVDRDDGGVTRPFSWAKALVTGRSVPLSFTVDQATLDAHIAELAAANRVEPIEPSIAAAADGGAMQVVAGRDGAAIDPAALGELLVATAEVGDTPIRVQIDPTPIAPRFSDADAQTLADKTTATTATSLVLTFPDGKSATVVSSTVRSWLSAVPGTGALELVADQDKIVADLPGLVGDLGIAPVPATFNVVDGRPEIVDGQLGLTCCNPNSAGIITAAIVAGQTTAAITLWPIGPEHDLAWATSLGIIEEVSSFTTQHPVGEPRVTNIHRIADLTRGMVIQPGEVFSLNDRVGPRTKEKGFVEAPVIYDDEYTTDVGGGVSQYATTLFNAAFFAGLDFEEYQSHTAVINRYPLGREATVSFPSPDLKFRNETPYGILIWPTYDEGSITVTFYSTPWVRGEQTGQTSEPKGPCTKYHTERTRTWVDGRTDVDEVVGVYAPTTGISCF
jgi:vancomycin resistance protein YoaR